MEQIWGLMVFLSNNQWVPLDDHLLFDDDFWDYIIDEAAKAGINTILLDVGDGVQFNCCPEICLPDAWSRERVHKELEKCRAKGIRIIPKLNFSSGHNYWMKQYRRMTSTPKYYEICSALIKELYEIFEQPEFLHIGMDEEYFFEDRLEEDMAIIRRPKLFVHDLQFLLNEVKQLGARAIIWSDSLVDFPEEYEKVIGVDDAILMPWYYDNFKKEHYTLISERFGPEHKYIKQGYTYVEEVPYFISLRERPCQLAGRGYSFMPTVSTHSKSEYNTDETVEYYRANMPSQEQLIGFMTAPWRETTWQYKETFDKSLSLMHNAIVKHGK